jgi:DNA-directed RNA polymerase I, II, and III subunit RPABC1
MNRDHIVNAFGTLLEMLRDRGEDVGEVVTKQHIEDVLKLDTIKQVIEVILNDIKVIFYTPAKFKWADVKKYFEDDKPFSTYFLIVQENITQVNMKSINALKLNIEIFMLSRLQFNITKHELVSKHEIVRDQGEITNILERYKLKSKTQLPIILKSDPVARYYNLKGGEIVKVTRPSETAGEYIMYRYCV